ncbi:hypothetical protein BJY04DRAFT_154972 [Aspergillus karnatakaensis]|uniref:uncharacterized protein n=1 Tax=Aspergillus karnatakaensis TaxID=1810916 RepID=UPI003CCCFAAF
MIRFLAPGGEAIVTGVHFGSQLAGVLDALPEGFSVMYLHNPDTLSRLWHQAGTETGTAWKFEVRAEIDQNCRSLDPHGCRLRWAAVRQ